MWKQAEGWLCLIARIVNLQPRKGDDMQRAWSWFGHLGEAVSAMAIVERIARTDPWQCGGRAGLASKLGAQRGPCWEARRSKDFIFILNYFGSIGKIGTKPTLKMEAAQVPFLLFPSVITAVSYRSFQTLCILQILHSCYAPTENVQHCFLCV